MTDAQEHDLQFAINVAQLAGNSTLKWFQNRDLDVDDKADGSPVTAADRHAEQVAREEISRRFPEDGIVGEEYDDVEGSSGRRWVIDPIDGTKAFTHGVPLYSTLVALIDDEGPAVGVIYLPALNETIAAGRGLGATFNGEPCRVSDESDLGRSFVMTSGFDYWKADPLRAVLASRAHLRTWGDGYGYALVASGRAEAMIDPQANPWDVAAMGVIITEAGGRFSNVDGREGATAWTQGSGIATNGAIHERVLGWLNPNG